MSPVHTKIPDSYSTNTGVNPQNSGLLSQLWMIAHYPRCIWENYGVVYEVGDTIGISRREVACKSYSGFGKSSMLNTTL